MVLTARRMTADEFLALPPEVNTQLVDGEIVVNDPTLRHNRIALELARRLANWTLDHPGTGEAGIGCNTRLNDDNVFVPDVWWVTEENILGRQSALFRGPQDLVVEVRSPSTWRYDVGTKKRTYERAGLPELWLVDTKADTVLVFRRTRADAPEFDVALEVGAGETLSTPFIPGFAVDLADLFDR